MQNRRFNLFLIVYFISLILLIESLFFLLAVIVSFIYREAIKEEMIYSFLVLFIPGVILYLTTFNKKINNITRKESILIVGSGWIIMALLGALPYIITQTIPRFSDAFFESMSGFTTTGSSILRDIESLPRGILFWRSETNWIGGMGIIVLIIALAPIVAGNSNYLYGSEMSNVADEKLMARFKQNARNLWLVYVGLTVAETIILYCAGLSFLDSLCHSFSTIATGGFSMKNASIAAYSPLVQYIVMVFMLLSGMNFTLHVLSIRKQFKKVIRNEELQLYLFIVVFIGTAITLQLFFWKSLPLEVAFRDAFFQVISVITATGFTTSDYLIWPTSAVALIMLLMFIGASSGSTGGGVKVIRNLIAFKKINMLFKQIFFPKAINQIRYNGQILKNPQVNSILTFIILYYFILGFGTLVMLTLGLDKATSFGAVITTMGGVGPGFGMVGPAGNFANIPEFGKFFLIIIMVLGRLEIYPVLILFTPWFWRNS
ncbi:Trk potassium uptake system protein TrkH [hydrothermal vent metagenome]|uniref:Trk potassium uptake system protein TrkH n=1 Tax=hydrothermal vent metagenome TaxID=652676 RepID=A0A3B0UB13_9ZZZZ